MGWVDWLLKPFRGRPTETSTPEPAPVQGNAAPTPAPEARAQEKTQASRGSGRARDERKARPKDKRKEASSEAAKPPRRNKKARKYAARQEQSAPRSEVLPLEEGERRYGAMVAPRPIPTPNAPSEPAQEAASPAAAAEAAQDQPSAPSPAREPAPAQPPRDPAEEARRAEAAENRRRARLPQFQALLSRTDALLAVEDAPPRHLVSARRQLVEGWARLGSPPSEAADELNAARNTRLAALDERIQAAAAVIEAQQQALAAQRMAVVEEARALAERENLKGAGPEMGELRAKLRALGKLSPEDPAAKAFAEAEARLKARQEQLRADRDTARAEALERLNQLVQRAETLARSTDPEGAAERVKGLQATWKTIRVPGPRQEVDEAWARFRAACDAVFAARTAARAEASRVALERMEAIVVRLEGLVENGTDGDPEDEITKALAAWRKAGRAPREAQQPLWERLQRAFDQLRAPPADLGEQDTGSLQFRPFEGLGRGEDH